MLDCDGWTTDFDAYSVEKVGNLFVLDSNMEQGEEIHSDNGLWGDEYVFRIYCYDSDGLQHRLTPGAEGGCTFYCCAIDEATAVLYIIDKQAVLLRCTGDNTMPAERRIPGEYVYGRFEGGGLTLVNTDNKAGFYSVDGKLLLSVPGCTRYGMRGDSLVVAIHDDIKALYTVDGHCIVPPSPGCSFEFLTYNDNRHIGIINDLGVSLCDISSGRPKNMFKGTFDLKELKGGYFENGKCVAVTRDSDNNYHVIDRNMRDTMRPFDRDYSITSEGIVICREVDGKTKYNLLSRSYEEILPEDADWVSQYANEEKKHCFLIGGFIIGYDNGMKLLCNRVVDNEKDIMGPFIDIKGVDYDYERDKEKLECTRPGGKVEYYMPDKKHEKWVPVEGNG